MCLAYDLTALAIPWAISTRPTKHYYCPNFALIDSYLRSSTSTYSPDTALSDGSKERKLTKDIYVVLSCKFLSVILTYYFMKNNGHIF